MKLKAIFFDIDGTLLDTREFIYQAFEHSLGAHGHQPFTREELRIVMGKTLEGGYQTLAQLDDVEDLMNTHRAFQAANMNLSIPYPHVAETLDALKKKGLKIAGITTRSRDSAKATLKLAGLMEYFEFFVGMDDVENPKPHPEPLERALKHFELRPDEAMMVGDSDVDIMAGKAAGTYTAGCAYGFHPNHIADAEPDYLIDDVKEILTIISQ
ncbi:MAG: HAD-IA family hydrolase [Weeksellaceae bacterium]